MGELGLTGFSNAKYWFGVTRFHPVFELLQLFAAERGVGDAARGWDPFHFIDLCAKSVKNREKEMLEVCQAVQEREWELLFEHCYRHLPVAQ